MANRNILDFPRELPPDKFFIWHWNGIRWPSGSRSIGYLTKRPASVSLPTMSWQSPVSTRKPDDIYLFDTRKDAETFWYRTVWAEMGHRLVGDEGSGYRIGTRADMIRLVGYPEDGLTLISEWMNQL